ncbi:phage tail protein [Blastochloris viridis]|uniref:Microcystin dependent protein n=1 Tax=Blastochloris viridis TaxID=1079 RepID=A0A0H5BQB8_BLAVI|nr:tail fiber protein [Blastochloris viridis]ALK09445.1 Phage Tail Collar Domain protein [Blastochloris viridis]BAS00674.1 microcystin dependent protein [Blastochloris viridis]CUU42108.1 Phage Tail Collar Domain protein [Blastochloris viridis]
MDPFLGQIMQVGFDYAPEGWMQCKGQTLQVSQYQALYSLLGTSFGGSGTTFMLPNLQGRTIIAPGAVATPSGSVNFAHGQSGGSATTALTVPQLPSHNHAATFTPTTTPLSATATLAATTTAANSAGPVANARFGTGVDGGGAGAIPQIYAPAGTSGTAVNLAGVSVTVSGGVTGGTVAVGNTGQASLVPTISPFVAINTIIAVQGLYPPRSD